MVYQDQINVQIELKEIPKRIISLVPSQTELLYDLGLEDEVVGITKFCVHPESWQKSKTRIGGTKNPKIEKILALKPDLVIANKEENRKEDVEEIMKSVPVWTSDIQTLEDNNNMISALGEMLNTEVIAQKLIQEINDGFAQFDGPRELGSVLYLIWKNPYMSVGSDTFIHHLLTKTGWTNAIKSKTRYPMLEESELIQLNPEYVFLSSEPFPFSEKHISEIQSLLPKSKVVLVDGEMFSWYGSRLQHSPVYIEELINKITR